MDTNYSEQLLNTMLKPENVIAVGEMLTVQDDWLNEVIYKYIWNPLKLYAEEKDMDFVIDSDETGYLGYNGICIHKKDWKYYGLFVWTDSKNYWNQMFIGISDYEAPKRSEKILKKDYQNLNSLKENPTSGWPYGWELLRSDIMNWDWNITEKIVSGEVANYIKNKFDEILQEIEERNIIMR